jgi:purine-binding chemotaxis protein CheW
VTSRQFATFTLGDRLYGVEVGAVQEVLRNQACTPVPLAGNAIAGLLSLRGEVVTAVDLRRRMSVPEDDRPAESMNVVIRLEDEVVSLLVDRIGDVVDVSDDLFEDPPDTLNGEQRDLVRGAYKLDGRLLHVLDITTVVDV